MKRKNAVDANRVFLLSIVLSQMLIFLVNGIGLKDAMALQFLLEVFLVLPGVGYLLGQGQSFKKSLGVNRLDKVEWLLLLPLAFCVDKIAEFINMLSQLIVPNLIANHMVELILRYPIAVTFFVVAVTPAICEELIYRGILYQGYRKSSVWVAVVLSAFLFGIMHMNLNQFSYAFVLGLLFALINEITGSILPSVLLHLYVNGRSVVLLYAAVNYLTGLREQYIAAEAAGNQVLMKQVLDLANGVPVDSVNWLEEYMNMGSGTVMETIQTLLPGFLVATAATGAVLYVLARRKRKAGFCDSAVLKMNREDSTTDSSRLSVVSPALIVGSLICIAFMFLKYEG